MRKWYLILMTAVGLALFMALGYEDPTASPVRLSVGASKEPESGLPAAKPAQVGIQAVVSVDAAAFAAIEDATAAFERDRPWIDVALANVPQEEFAEQYRSLAMTGTAPDVAMVPTSWVRLEAAEGRLLALDDYISAERQSQWFETVRGAVRWNGYVWGVPVDWDPYVFVIPKGATGGAERQEPMSVRDWLGLVGGDAAKAATDRYGARLLADWGRAPLRETDPGADADGVIDPPQTLTAADASAKQKDDARAGAAQAEAGDAAASAGESDAGSDGDGDEVVGGEIGGESEGATAPAAAEAPPEAAEADARVGPSAATAALAGGRAPWALVPLSEAMRFAREADEGEWAVTAFVPEPASPPGSMPPFAGSSYVISPSTRHAVEAAEWIRYVTEEQKPGEPATSGDPAGLQAGWPVYRAAYGLPSALGGEPPSRTGGGFPDLSFEAALPTQRPTDAAAAPTMLRPIMRLLDAAPGTYGTPLDATTDTEPTNVSGAGEMR